MAETFRWTCPMSTRGSIASLTPGSLRAGVRNAPPPGELRYGPQGRGPFIAANPRAARSTRNAFTRPDISYLLSDLGATAGVERSARSHLSTGGFQTGFDASRQTRKDSSPAS